VRLFFVWALRHSRECFCRVSAFNFRTYWTAFGRAELLIRDARKLRHVHFSGQLHYRVSGPLHQELLTWIIGRIWPAGHPRPRAALINYKTVLQDFLNMFDSHAENRRHKDSYFYTRLI
jgi:hypothetical protein